MNDSEIESEIKSKGLTAPRVTPQRINDVIASEHYFTAQDGVMGAYAAGGSIHSFGCTPGNEARDALCLLTFCVLVLDNGFTVTGESACASPENFDAELGRKIARQNAVNKIWPLEGYLLKSQIHEGQS